MKKCTYVMVLLAGILLHNTANAQIKACIFCATNVNDQPGWGPSGYQYVYYYYIPEMEIYYYVPRHQFIYQKHGDWVSSSTLPARYIGIDLYKAYKVVINDPDPYLQHATYKARFDAYKKRHDQPVNRYRHNWDI